MFITPSVGLLNQRSRPEVFIQKIDEDTITNGLRAILDHSFKNILSLEKHNFLPEWIISCTNLDYLFGFKIIHKKDKIIGLGSINYWSMWAEDYTISKLSFIIGSQAKNNNITYPIEDFSSWLDYFGIDIQSIELPQEFAKIAGMKKIQ